MDQICSYYSLVEMEGVKDCGIFLELPDEYKQNNICQYSNELPKIFNPSQYVIHILTGGKILPGCGGGRGLYN